ncbi:MAG: hypothetical protein EHM64_04490 [Ignavibacteriae bacterium]|nr:MAG: hypothetical protein EHM64_04490 [Ignavibacteriota bacterium]
MNTTSVVVMNISLMVVFGVIAVFLFAENVRTVQIIGLMASGAVLGAAFTRIITALKSRQTSA